MNEPRTPTGQRLWREPGAFKDALYQRRLRTILDLEDEARAQEQERWSASIRSNHGQRGHNEPFDRCPREVCELGRALAELTHAGGPGNPVVRADDSQAGPPAPEQLRKEGRL